MRVAVALVPVLCPSVVRILRGIVFGSQLSANTLVALLFGLFSPVQVVTGGKGLMM